MLNTSSSVLFIFITELILNVSSPATKLKIPVFNLSKFIKEGLDRDVSSVLTYSNLGLIFLEEL
jgi:hypothetical protein